MKAGDRIKIEKIKGKEGAAVKLDALLITDEKGTKIDIGKPLVKSKIEAKILKQDKAKKILVVKYKRKTRYRRRVGHRQPYTQVEIVKI